MKTSERLRKQINDDKFPGAGFVVLSLEMLKKSKGAKVIVALRIGYYIHYASSALLPSQHYNLGTTIGI